MHEGDSYPMANLASWVFYVYYICIKRMDNALKDLQSQPLVEYIDQHYGGNKAAFARANNISKQKARVWINAGYRVTGNYIIIIKQRVV